MIIVVLGVMGAGKTTVGAALASRLGWTFLDADDFHTQTNWAKLERGEALTDADRIPWLASIREALASHSARGESVVLACSALRQAYREALMPAGLTRRDVRFVYLDADPALTAERVKTREHRASGAVLESQYAVLEEPEDALRLPAGATVDALVESVVDEFELGEKS